MAPPVFDGAVMKPAIEVPPPLPQDYPKNGTTRHGNPTSRAASAMATDIGRESVKSATFEVTDLL